MSSVKILHTADLHLGSSRTGVSNGRSEIENTFLKIINICKKESVDFLLIAGDLFESPFVATDDAKRILTILEQIPDTIVAISSGNHDCACPGSVYLKNTFPSNTIIFSSFMEYVDFPEKGVRLWGAGFTERFERIPLIQEIESSDLVNICLMHGEVVSENSDSIYNPLTLSAIGKSGFDYLALGHIHKRSNIEKVGNTFFAYSGCPDGMGFDEAGSKGVYLGTVAKGKCQLDYIELSSRKYVIKSIDVTECKNSFDVAELIKSELKLEFGDNYLNNLYRITLVGELSTDTTIRASQVASVLKEEINYIEVYDQTDTNLNDLSTFAEETSLRGIYVKKLLQKMENASDEERHLYKNALKIGIRAFSKGVSLNDN